MRPALGLAVLLMLGTVALDAAGQSAQTLDKRMYAWYGQVVGVDQAAKLVTVKARIPEYVARYVNRFKPGEKLELPFEIIRRQGRNAKQNNVTLEDAKVDPGQ